jgi:tetratricopeptide (TPR) repeat protein
MKRLRTIVIASIAASALFVLLGGGNCSRARVESMNHMNEGVVYAQNKRYVEATKALQLATVTDPTNDQAFYNLALVNIELRKFEEAKENLNQAIAINGDVAGYHEKLGTVCQQLEDWNGAKTAFERAIEIDPDLFKAYYKLAQVLEQLDDRQNALHRYTEAIQRGPRFIEAYVDLGRLYYDLGYMEQAAQVLQSGLSAAIPATDEEARLHHMLGAVYQEQGNYDQAIEQFRAALDINPGMQDALFSLGWAYSLTDNREEARRYLKKFTEVAQDAPEHYMKAARDRMSELEQP